MLGSLPLRRAARARGERHLPRRPRGRPGDAVLASRAPRLELVGGALRGVLARPGTAPDALHVAGGRRGPLQRERLLRSRAARAWGAAGTAAPAEFSATPGCLCDGLPRPELADGWHEGGVLLRGHARAVPQRRQRAALHLPLLPCKVRAAHGLSLGAVVGLLLRRAAAAARDLVGRPLPRRPDGVPRRGRGGLVGGRQAQPRRALRPRQRDHTLHSGVEPLLPGGGDRRRAPPLPVQRRSGHGGRCRRRPRVPGPGPGEGPRAEVPRSALGVRAGAHVALRLRGAVRPPRVSVVGPRDPVRPRRRQLPAVDEEPAPVRHGPSPPGPLRRGARALLRRPGPLQGQRPDGVLHRADPHRDGPSEPGAEALREHFQRARPRLRGIQPLRVIRGLRLHAHDARAFRRGCGTTGAWAEPQRGRAPRAERPGLQPHAAEAPAGGPQRLPAGPPLRRGEPLPAQQPRRRPVADGRAAERGGPRGPGPGG
mmetsp:Transcript_106611/g.339460  ORF Transcript_106611/g.339460 Transcript_106611/m.339460 type:complete len:483 (-) Transcript_106611:191-1639(-)